ncbi:STAS-like domain-containing protein [Pseudomonas lurida]|uniref:STAS-like domain-containing protein n=1 Tax=Pseudomonas lurida TaxID=244566 RepID=UPI0009B84B53|nr:DUF4325 domain-containing protein [Pseudomonas lurida]
MNLDEVDVLVGAFSRTPYGRYESDGDYNGARFRDEILAAHFRDDKVKKVNVYLDTVEDGYEYGSSFLEEAFGGLVRVCGIPKEIVLAKINIITAHRDYILEIKDYISGV